MNRQSNDKLYQAAAVWKELTEYCYIITYGYKKQLNTISLTFSLADFPHLAGFQYLRDLSLPRYNPTKLVDIILDKKITYGQISKGIQYENLVNPRLESLIRLKDILEKDFKIFYFMPHKYPFTTMIKADYLCCSAFTKGSRDYEANQPSRTILKKERLHIKTQTSTVLYNRLTFS